MSSLPAEVKSLLTSLIHVAENVSFRTFIDKAYKLDAEITELKGSKNVQDRQLSEAVTKLEDAGEVVEELEKQLKANQELLRGKEMEIKELQNKLRTQKRDNDNSLCSTKAELKEKSKRLSELEGYTLKLEPDAEDLYAPLAICCHTADNHWYLN